MIVHMVLLKVRPDAPDDEISATLDAVGALGDVIPGMVDYAWGPYSSPEGMNKGFTHGFCMTFDTAEHRDAYLPHPAHEAVKARVLAILDGGLDGVVAFDFER